MSNAYVVSVTSWYLTTSRFDYKHVATICYLPDMIPITGYRNVEAGFFSQPLSFQSIMLSLDFTQARPPQILVTDLKERFDRSRAFRAANAAWGNAEQNETN